jgi:ribosome-associated heat shock protein Hsp15
MTEPLSADKVRLDRWLWAARFFKTRTAAADAVDAGRVQLNGVRVKRSALVRLGSEVRIRKPPYDWVVEVRALSEHRGPATRAAQLYRETEGSAAARARLQQQLRHQPSSAYQGKGRPTKRDRRRLDAWNERR